MKKLLIILLLVSGAVAQRSTEIQQAGTRVALSANGTLRLNFVSGVTCVFNAATNAVDCTGSGSGGFTAPKGWTIGQSGWNSGTDKYGLINTVTLTSLGTGTATFWDNQLNLTAVSAAAGAGDIHAYNINTTITGPAQAASTHNNFYSVQTENLTGAGSVADHVLNLVIRQINNPAASTTTTLASTAWMSQGFANFAGTAGNVEVMNLNWDANLNGAGTITNGLKTLDVGLPGTITGGMVPPSVAGVSVGDPTFAPGTSKAAFAVGTPSTTGAFALWIPSGGNGHFTNPIFIADAAYSYALEGWLLGTSTSLNGNFTAANTPLQLSCSGACGLGIYNGVIDWFIGENASNDLTLQRPDNGTTALTVANATGIVTTPKFGITNLLFSSAAPTISSGFGTSPSVVAPNGTAAFTVNVGTGGTATNGVIGLPTATNGWVCTGQDLTTQSTTVFLLKQIATTTSTATMANFNTAGAQAAWVASDILHISCSAR